MGSVKENLIAGICAYPNCTCSPHSSCLPEVDVKRAYDAALEMLQGTSADLGPGELPLSQLTPCRSKEASLGSLSPASFARK